MGRHLVLALLLTAMGAASPAFAQGPSTAGKQHAQDLFARGVDLSKQNRWRDALAAFEESGRLYPHARTRFNIGYCERGLGRWTRARRRFREALAMDEATPDKQELSPSMKEGAARFIRDAEEAIGTVALVLTGDGMKVSVDGRPLEHAEEGRAVAGTREPGPPEPLAAGTWKVQADAGTHVVVVVSDGRRSRHDMHVVAGETVTLTPSVSPQDPSDGEPAPVGEPLDDAVRDDAQDDAQNEGEDDTVQLVGAGLVGGLGVLGVVSGAVLLSRALSRHDDAAAACPSAPNCPDDRAYSLSNDARELGNLATASFVVGGAGLLCSAFLLVTAPSIGLVDDRIAVEATPGGVRLRGRF